MNVIMTGGLVMKTINEKKETLALAPQRKK